MSANGKDGGNQAKFPHEDIQFITSATYKCCHILKTLIVFINRSPLSV